MDRSNQIFEALASKPRIRILEALREKRMECTDPKDCSLSRRCCNVGELAERLQLAQPTVSHHLKVLRRANLITTEKDGRTLFCTLNDETFEELNGFIESFYRNGGDQSCS